MSEQQEESEDRYYIQEGDIVLVNCCISKDICRVIHKKSEDNKKLYVQSLLHSYSAYEANGLQVSLLIPKESLLFQYKMEDDMFLAYNDGQLVMRMHCPNYHTQIQTKHYVKIMSNLYALRQLRETCKDETILELIKD